MPQLLRKDIPIIKKALLFAFGFIFSLVDFGLYLSLQSQTRQSGNSILVPKSRREVKQDFAKLEQKAKSFFMQSSWGKSIPYLKKMYKYRPYDESIQFRLAQALLYQEAGQETKRWKKDLKQSLHLLLDSVKIFRQLQAQAELLAQRLFHLGVAHWYSGNTKKALAAFQESFRLDRRLLPALYNCFAIEESMGHLEKARLSRDRYEQLSAASGQTL